MNKLIIDIVRQKRNNSLVALGLLSL
jgi:hypothetical protein